MSTTSNCGCGCSNSTTPCDNPIAELPRYYPRQLITPDDLTLEQNYFRDRLRRHNRLLHGWGVVCGALVCPATTTNPDGTTSLIPWNVFVQTGYILGPYGDEIILDCVRTVDVRTPGVAGVAGETCIDAPDPWCTQVYSAPSTVSTTVYIAVQYQQSLMRPVRVQPTGCGCNDSTCEYSRWHDGYQIGVLPTCPCGNEPVIPTQTIQASQGSALNPTGALGGGLLGTNLPTRASSSTNCNDCPECPCGPWVGLAMVQFDQNGAITCIDNCICRRMAATLSHMTRPCKCAQLTVTSINPSSASVAVGATATLTITGTGFACGATASFDSALSVNQATVQNSTTVVLTVSPTSAAAASVTAANAAATFTPNLAIRNMDGDTVSFTGLSVTISPATATSAATSKAIAQAPVTAKTTKSSPPKPSKP